MKKILSLILVFIMLLSLAACGDAGKTPSGDGTTTKNSSGTTTTQKGNTETPDTYTQATMEARIASLLSAVGGPSTIKLFGGKSIEFTEDGIFFSGDYWDIKGTSVTFAQIKESLNEQLEPYGFKTYPSLFGTTWYINAGSEKLGITVSIDDGSGTVMLTHGQDKYTKAYVNEMEAKMPDIITGTNALDVLPENFLLKWQYEYGTKITVIRKDGSLYYCNDGSENTSSPSGASHIAYIKQADGSYKEYNWYGSKTNYGSPRDFTAEDLKEKTDNWFDAEGNNDNGSPSTWLQICKDYDEGEFAGANYRFTISQTLEKTGTENIAGVNCQVCADDGIWTKYEFAYDKSTGILFRVKKTEKEETKTLFNMLEYSTNPSTLGEYNP